MAEERDDSQRTEEPTQRRLDEVHKKGVADKSSKLAAFTMLAGGTLALLLFSGAAVQRFAGEFRVFAILAPSVGLILVAALAGHLVQHRPVPSAARLEPELSKLSPIQGFKKLYGVDGIVNLLKGIAKITLVGTAAFLALWPGRSRLVAALDLNAAGIAGVAVLVTKVLVAALIVLAALDYLYKRQRFIARHRMTHQELKDEVKQSEADPQIKARIRQIRFERSNKRMIAAVPEATVVIANPTHYAVALRYESGKMGAPVCVARGVDHLALTIRKVAEENEVPVVENPPLARALYAAVEVDAEIPADHCKAVAQVIGYVMRLAHQSKFRRH